MTVIIDYKTRLQGSVTPSALNQETDIINLGDQLEDFILEGQISLQNMDINDIVILRAYIAVDGTNQVKSDEITFVGKQTIPVVRVPATTLAYNEKPRITVTQTAGTTIKSFPYTFIYQVMKVM
jgi:hypothetical protein